MIKILFLIHDLGQGGAEKVLVNLVNNMDRTKFDITVTALFGGGINEQFLSPDVHYHTVWKKMLPANSKWMKLMSTEQLHALCIKERYDIEVSYLEGPAARVVSGCKDAKTKLVSWIHVEQHSMACLAAAFRSEKEAGNCYNRFDQTICVSEFVKKDFIKVLDFDRPCKVLYNTVETEKIKALSVEPADIMSADKSFKLIAVGSLKQAKGMDRLVSITQILRNEGYDCHLYILGKGPLRESLEKQAENLGIKENVIFLGYETNPYKYVAKADLFVCASHAEGFSTATTEALIVGTPVCTVDVSGMAEMLGSDNEYGVVTENDDQALYAGIRSFLDSSKQLTSYKKRAMERGKYFSTENTVRAAENMFIALLAG